MRDPHEVLGVPAGASQAEIRRAFKRLARAYHPDAASREGQSDAHRRFLELQAAYEALLGGGRSLPEQPGAYSASRARPWARPEPAPRPEREEPLRRALPAGALLAVGVLALTLVALCLAHAWGGPRGGLPEVSASESAAGRSFLHDAWDSARNTPVLEEDQR